MSFLNSAGYVSTSASTEETLELSAFAVWEGQHPEGPVVVFRGKPTAYVVRYKNPRAQEILNAIKISLNSFPVNVRLDWKKGELLSVDRVKA